VRQYPTQNRIQTRHIAFWGPSRLGTLPFAAIYISKTNTRHGPGGTNGRADVPIVRHLAPPRGPRGPIRQTARARTAGRFWPKPLSWRQKLAYPMHPAIFRNFTILLRIVRVGFRPRDPTQSTAFVGPPQFCAECTYTRTCAQSKSWSLPEACNLGVSLHGAFAAPSFCVVAMGLSCPPWWRRTHSKRFRG